MLTSQDLTQITSIVTSAVKAAIKTEVNPIFAALNQKIDTNHREVLSKFESLRVMTNEDIQAAYHDIDKLDKRVTRLEDRVL